MKLWQKDKTSLKEVERFTVGRDQEMDLFFWVTVFVILDQLPALLWLVAFTQVAAMAIRFFLRASEMARHDL